MESTSEFGIMGLGKIGANLALQALQGNYRVVGYDIHGVPDQVRSAGAEEADSPAKFLGELSSPRKVFVYVPAGSIVDQVLDQLADVLEKGDVLVDGGNSYWGDSLRRHERYTERGLHFVDLGTSGGIEGAAEGACFMAGGRREAVELVEPILKTWDPLESTCRHASLSIL